MEHERKLLREPGWGLRRASLAAAVVWGAVVMAPLAPLRAKPAETGLYFPKKKYIPEDLPGFNESRDRLPEPVLDAHPGWIRMYWKCWRLAFKGLKKPPRDSPLVSNWLDEAFSDNIFQWDTIFMMMFARYGHEAFDAIQSLDNFYALQRKSGLIGRELRESDGALIHWDFEGGLFAETGWKNIINPPLFSWAEMESWRVTGDSSRFKAVLPVLDRYARWLNRDGDPHAADWEANGRISRSAPHKLYWNTPLGSGMDNTPRPTDKGAGWVEMSSQMVIMYRHMAAMASAVGSHGQADSYRREADSIAQRINRWCWNEKDGFYYDVTADASQFRKKTLGGFWPLLAEVASRKQAARLVEHLENPDEFWRTQVFPTVSADEEEYSPVGEYWRGGVWAPTNVMVIKGLEAYGYEDLARRASEKYLQGMYEVFLQRETVFENYAPDSFSPGIHNGGEAKRDFVGWSGCGPVQLLIENVLGFRPDAASATLSWHLLRKDRHGIRRLNMGGIHLGLVAEPHPDGNSTKIEVSCDAEFTLKIVRPHETRAYLLEAGRHVLVVP